MRARTLTRRSLKIARSAPISRRTCSPPCSAARWARRSPPLWCPGRGAGRAADRERHRVSRADERLGQRQRWSSGPISNLWYTRFNAQLDRAGHARRDGHRVPAGHRGVRRRPRRRAGRRALVHGAAGEQDRADHDRRGGHRVLDPDRRRRSRRRSRPGRTARCGSPSTRRTRSGGSRPPGRSPSSRSPPRPRRRTRSSRGRTARSGSPSTTATRSGGSPPSGTITEFALPTANAEPARDRGRCRRRAVVHRVAAGQVGRITTTGVSHRVRRRRDDSRGRSRPASTATSGSPTSTRPRSGGSRRTAPRPTSPCRRPTGVIARGPDDAMWFTETAADRLARDVRRRPRGDAEHDAPKPSARSSSARAPPRPSR